MAATGRTGGIGSWLEGPPPARSGGTRSGGTRSGGTRMSGTPTPGAASAGLGLPAQGPGAAAGLGRRFGGYVVDVVPVVLVGQALRLGAGWTAGSVGWLQTGLLLAHVLLTQVVLGRSLGMLAVGTRLVSAHGGGRPGAGWVLLRTFLLVLPVPGLAALVTDGDGRGLHDRAAGTVVVRV